MPSILVITERYDPEKFLINDLVREWVSLGIVVRVLTQVPSYPRDRLFPDFPNSFSVREEQGVRVTRFKTVLGYKRSVVMKILNYFQFMVRSIFHSIRAALQCDCVFVYHTGPLTQALPLVILKTIFRKRTAIWTQDVWPDTVFAYGFPNHGAFAVLLKAFVRVMYRFCDEVIVSSPGFVTRLAPYLKQEKSVHFIPQWVPRDFDDTVPSELNFPGTGSRFMFAGNVGVMQNLENVVMAFSRIDPSTASFFILGDGSNRFHLECLVKERKIGNVHFLGSVDQRKVKYALRQCDFAILSLTGNPLIGLTVPAKFQAYLSAGRPILAVTDGEVKEIVEREGIGMTARPDDVGAIAAAIQNMVQKSPEDLDQYRINMKNLLETKYDKAKIVSDLTNLVLRRN